MSHPDEMGTLALAMALAHLRDKGRVLSAQLGDLEPTKETLARQGVALLIEVAEFVNETPWKNWKDKPVVPEVLAEEFADVLHFIGNWMGLLDKWGISAIDIALAYETKNKKNHARLAGKVEAYGAKYAAAQSSSADVDIPEDLITQRLIDYEDDDYDEYKAGLEVPLAEEGEGDDPLL